MRKVVVVWCDSPAGLISTRIDEDGSPVEFDMSQVDLDVVYDETDLFKVLGRKDGTKVALPIGLVEDCLGWSY